MNLTLVRQCFVSLIIIFDFGLLVGGGIFTGRYKSLDDTVEAGSRFDADKTQGKVSKPLQQYIL